MDAELIAKAKRRIKRAIETGEHSPRTYKLENGHYQYKVRHRNPASFLYFRVDKLNRVYSLPA